MKAVLPRSFSFPKGDGDGFTFRAVPVVRKELADHLGSWRFAILFFVVVIAGVLATYQAGQSIRGDVAKSPEQTFVFLRLFTSGNPISFVSFIAFLGPLLGIAFGFDAINSEQQRGTLGKLLSQPV